MSAGPATSVEAFGRSWERKQGRPAVSRDPIAGQFIAVDAPTDKALAFAAAQADRAAADLTIVEVVAEAGRLMQAQLQAAHRAAADMLVDVE